MTVIDVVWCVDIIYNICYSSVSIRLNICSVYNIVFHAVFDFLDTSCL